jgi:hypothetical protein
MVQIRTSIDIDAPIERVWELLLDLESWKEWSKWTVLEGLIPITGAHGTLAASFDGDDKWQRYPMYFIEVSPEKYFLNWGGSVAGGCLFKGDHHIQLTKNKDGITHLEHNEDMTGLLPALGVGMPYAKVAENYAKMNAAFKSYVVAKHA